MAQLEQQSIGGGPINRLSEIFADPQIQAREVVRDMRLGSGEAIQVVANPVRLSQTPVEYRLPPPLLGEHTDAILRSELGFSDDRLLQLRKIGVI